LFYIPQLTGAEASSTGMHANLVPGSEVTQPIAMAVKGGVNCSIQARKVPP